MSSIRLFVLSTLAERGEMHGHQIRLQAAEDRAEQWASVKPGALYGALARLARENLIAVVRSEREGNRPERTVYAITVEGRRALAVLHEQMLRSVVVPTDPFDLALAHTAATSTEALHDIVTARLLDYRARVAAARAQQASAAPWLTPAEEAVITHQLARLETEVRWHEALLDLVSKITTVRLPS